MEIDRFKEVHFVQPPTINRATTEVISKLKGTPNGRVHIPTLFGPQLTVGKQAYWERKRKKALEANAATFKDYLLSGLLENTLKTSGVTIKVALGRLPLVRVDNNSLF